MKIDGLLVSELTAEEAQRFAKILENYFPWLWTDDEANGGDTVDELIELAMALGEPVRQKL